MASTTASPIGRLARSTCACFTNAALSNVSIASGRRRRSPVAVTTFSRASPALTRAWRAHSPGMRTARLLPHFARLTDQPGWLALRSDICWFIVQKSYRTPTRKSPPVSR
ncbi:MAG: hypothetical protein AW07_00372 [Candidatus Accumulibacter sp. SK-11]|nr:MAG: hypothetical protein AW07_00372 [Candidatus Accumulibacter sp. SK-11]